MFTKEQIDNWIAIGLAGDNHRKENIFIDRFEIGSIKRDLLEMKVLVDRWDTVTEYFIFNSIVKDFIRSHLDGLESLSCKDDNMDLIWGSKIHYSDNIPIDKCMAFSTENLPAGRNIAVFEFNLDKIQRVQNLKTFW